MSVTESPILFGRNQHRTRQFSILAAAICLVSTLVYTAIVLGSLPGTLLFMVGPMVMVLGMATVTAYLNDGLLMSGLITGAFALGGILAMHIDANLGSVDYPVSLTGSLSIIVLFIGIDVGAFVIGAGTRRVVTYTSS